jgi:hypothetical protein
MSTINLEPLVEQRFRNIFDTSTDIFRDSEVRVSCKDLSGADIGSIVVHKFVIYGKCQEVDAAFFADPTLKELTFVSHSIETVTQFFKLLYGFQLKVECAEILSLWKFASSVGYSKTDVLKKTLLYCMGDFSSQKKLALLESDQFTNEDKMTILQQFTLKSLRDDIIPVCVHADVLRMIALYTIEKYKTDTTAQKVIIESHVAELKSSKFERDMALAQTGNYQPPVPQPSASASQSPASLSFKSIFGTKSAAPLGSLFR